MLQGVWHNADTDELSFYAKGDTLFFPDSTCVPSYFCIVDDSLEIGGANTDRYKIIRQTPHLLIFNNLNDEQVVLKKSTNSADTTVFLYRNNSPSAKEMNKKDSSVIYKNSKVRFTIIVKPSSEKVLKQTYTNDGIQVDNVYFDNDVFVTLKEQNPNGKRTIFDSQIKKMEFAKIVPSSFISQSVFSAFTFEKINAEGVHFNAVLSLPETVAIVSYNVDACITNKGELIIHDIE